MRQITTVKGQTIFDLAVQEYGNMELAFQILSDNPELTGLNDLPVGMVLPVGIDFDVSHPIKEGVIIQLQDFLETENTLVAKELGTVIS